MMMDNGDGTFTGGPLDVHCILHDTGRGTYHTAFFEESPLPGPILAVGDTGLVRLKSRMHHTAGSPTLGGALAHLDDLATRIRVPAENVWRKPIPWDGVPAIVWFTDNWLGKGEQPAVIQPRLHTEAVSS
jgi:hypothetical protein